MTDIIIPEIFKQFPNVISGISTKIGGNASAHFCKNMSFTVGDKKENVLRNREMFFNSLGITSRNISFQRQTHSVNSNYVKEKSFFEDSDALYTDIPGNFIAVSIADCIPVLIYESDKKVVAGIHSGWKGTCAGISRKTLRDLQNRFDIRAENVYAYIGPGISFDNFQVGMDVYYLFPHEVKKIKNGIYYVDLKKNIYNQLVDFGVKSYNIEMPDLCTYKEKNTFHSYRRDREKSGRMLAVIGMSEKSSVLF